MNTDLTQHELNQQKLTQWLAEHRGILLKTVLAFTSDPVDQEDLLQEMAVALWKSIDQFRGESKESTWIYKVALFTATTWSRRESRRKTRTQVFETERLPEKRVQLSDPRQEWLIEALQTFEVVDRTLLLSSLEGFSHAETAQLTGLSKSNVGVRLHRLRKQLVELAKEQFNDV